MNYRTLLRPLLFILLVGYSNLHFGQSYKIACFNDYPPYSSINEDGNATGFLIDWWELWSKESGIAVSFVPGSLKECADRLDKSVVDIIAGGFYSEELSKKYGFGDQILGTQAILCIKKDLSPISIDSISFDISLVKNGYTGMYMKDNHPNISLNFFNSNTLLYNAVNNEMIDSFIYITPNSVLDLVDLSIPKGYKQFEILFTNNLRPMVTKGNKKILADIMKGSESMSNEDLLEVAKKWNVFDDKVTVNKSFLYVSLGSVLLCIILLILVFKRSIFKKKRFGSTNLQEEINKGESDFLEFKSSLRWDYRQNIKNKILEQVVAKTISAFLNSDGGTLIIGIDDEGTVLGLKNDYDSLTKSNKDGFVLTLTTIINNMLGKHTHKFINIKITKLNGKEICVIHIQKSNAPVFLIKGDKEEFFIRASASSQPLGLKDSFAYIESHWA